MLFRPDKDIQLEADHYPFGLEVEQVFKIASNVSNEDGRDRLEIARVPHGNMQRLYYGAPSVP